MALWVFFWGKKTALLHLRSPLQKLDGVHADTLASVEQCHHQCFQLLKLSNSETKPSDRIKLMKLVAHLAALTSHHTEQHLVARGVKLEDVFFTLKIRNWRQVRLTLVFYCDQRQ